MHLHESNDRNYFFDIINIVFRKMFYVLKREILQLIVMKRRKDVWKTETAEMTSFARRMTLALPRKERHVMEAVRSISMGIM